MKKYLFAFLFLCITATVYGAWPSDSARTKNWGNETLTDADLEGQFDIVHTYINDMMDASTGHKHDATTNEGPKIAVLADTVTTSPLAFSGQVTAGGLTSSGTLDVTGAVDLDSTLNVDGGSTLGALTSSGTVKMSGDVTIVGSLSVSGRVQIVGLPVSRNQDTVYRATTDGIVTLYNNVNASVHGQAIGYTDSANPPTTPVVGTSCYGSQTYSDIAGFSFPVRKGNYWYVSYDDSGVNSLSIYWNPLGQ